jgi:DNA helicase-2/ATP-dependent DNA helicase PcrA
VAITRAEEHCFLSYARSRFKYGKMEFAEPSRFLREIESAHRERPAGASSNPAQPVYSRPAQPAYSRPAQPANSRPAQPQQRLKPLQTSAPSASAGSASVREGQAILHERFGRGVILKVEGTGENTKATVRFDNAGEKQLLMKFARFQIIE